MSIIIQNLERTPDNNNRLNTEVVNPLRNFSTFWRCFGLSLINYEIELDLTWSKNCIISEILRAATVAEDPNANPPIQEVNATEATSATFEINNAKFYVSVVT